jgi:hypothetical protein
LGFKHALACSDKFLFLFGTIAALGGCWSEALAIVWRGGSSRKANRGGGRGEVREARNRVWPSGRARVVSETDTALDQPIVARRREQN